MTRSLREPDLLDEVRRLQEEVRQLRIRGSNYIDDFMILDNKMDGGIINNAWLVDGYAPESCPDYPDGDKLGVVRVGPMVYWEGAVMYDAAATDPVTALSLISWPFATLPEQFRPANFTQFTIISDTNNNFPPDNVITTFQASIDGWVGFSRFIYFDMIKPTMDNTVMDAPRDGVTLNFDNICYRGAEIDTTLAPS